jgi:methionyl-tRNA formyltransferase
MARVIFMGTPQFAVPTLQALVEHHEVVGVVTQPDGRAGRGRKVVVSPVKQVATERELGLLQPGTLNDSEVVSCLAGWHPDVIVVAAFGQLLPLSVLDLPPYGSINVHASLLPRYRGAAPISAAILDGEPVTGITIMRMDEGLDTGPVLTQAECPIAPDETTASLTAKLAELGAQLLIETLAGWLEGAIEAQPQDDAAATYCDQLEKADGLLDWSQPAAYLDRQVRACDPWPGTYTTWQGVRLKVLRARPQPGWECEGQQGLVRQIGEGIGVVTGQGALELIKVQLAGKKPMPAALFARGQRDLVGGFLGT